MTTEPTSPASGRPAPGRPTAGGASGARRAAMRAAIRRAGARRAAARRAAIRRAGARRAGGRWRRAGAASLAAALAGGGLAGCGQPPSQREVELRVLVVSVGDRSADAGLDLMARTLEQVGVPYDVLDSSTTELTDTALRAQGRGRYNGIVLTQADLYTPSGSGFTSAEWQRLHAYEREFGVRESIVAGFPVTDASLDLDYGMGATGTAPTVTGRWVAPAGTGRLFSYVNTDRTLEVPEYSVWGTPRDDGTGPEVTPLLVDDANPSRALVSRLDYPDGREVLLSTVGNAWYRLHSTLLAYQFLDFATKGLFLGGRYVHLSTHTDDMFLADELWDPALKRTNPDLSYRITPADLDAARAGQEAFRAEHPLAADWRLEFPFNGVGAQPDWRPNPRISRPVAEDTRLDSGAWFVNYGAAGSLVVGRSAAGESRAILRATDPAPPAAEDVTVDRVDRVVLGLTVTSQSAGLPVQVCPLTESWTEGTGGEAGAWWAGATWSDRSTMFTAWSSPGGTHAADRCVSATLAGPGPAEIDITPIWQAWQDGQANHGVVIRAGAEGQAVLASAEAASGQPLLGFDTAAAPDPLTRRAVELGDRFGWINHTYRALQMDRLCPDPDEPQPDECPRTDYRTAHDEIARNREVWQQLGLPGYEEGLGYLLSDSHAGLHDRRGTEEDPSDDVPFPEGANPEFLRAAQDLGVRFIASDASRPNQDREQRIPGFDLVLLPRYPTNVYVNATTPAENLDEHNWIYHGRHVAEGRDPCTTPGAICAPRTYDELLAAEADAAVGHMLSGKAWPHYFHQSNLRDYGGGRSLQLDWMDAVLTRYEQLLTLPVRSPTPRELGTDALDRLVAAEQNVRGWVNVETGVVTLQADGPARPVVTGLAGGESYGGQSIGKVDVDATARTFTVEPGVADVLPPPTTTTISTSAPSTTEPSTSTAATSATEP